jgi:hypothetical protein
MRNVLSVVAVLVLLALVSYMDSQDLKAEQEYRDQRPEQAARDAEAMREHALCVQRKIC